MKKKSEIKWETLWCTAQPERNELGYLVVNIRGWGDARLVGQEKKEADWVLCHDKPNWKTARRIKEFVINDINTQGVVDVLGIGETRLSSWYWIEKKEGWLKMKVIDRSHGIYRLGYFTTMKHWDTMGEQVREWWKKKKKENNGNSDYRTGEEEIT